MKLVNWLRDFMSLLPYVLIGLLSISGAVSIILKGLDALIDRQIQKYPLSHAWLKMEAIVNFEMGAIGAFISFLDQWVAFNRSRNQ